MGYCDEYNGDVWRGGYTSVFLHVLMVYSVPSILLVAEGDNNKLMTR